ncbi:MAG: hypothetical protein HOP19_25980 [Acidobacteria bacterium]|nr:hypothetical protein [Acidobacteriota bacterium]
MNNQSTHLTILTKNSLFSFLGIVKAELVEDMDDIEFEGSEVKVNGKHIIAIVKHDPREGQPFLKQYDTSGEALKSYEDAITTSLDRGWSVVYRGLPMYG